MHAAFTLLVLARTAQACCDAFVVAHNLPIQTNGLGLYIRTTWHDGAPVYKQVGGDQYRPADQYLFRNANLDWVVGPDYHTDVGGLNGYGGAGSCPSDVSTWRYTTSGDWITSSGISVKCTPACEKYNIELISGSLPEDAYPNAQGEYAALAGAGSVTRGEPVYMRGNFWFFQTDYFLFKGTNSWMVGESDDRDADGGYITLGTGDSPVSELPYKYREPGQRDRDAKWIESSAIRVSCEGFRPSPSAPPKPFFRGPTGHCLARPAEKPIPCLRA